MNDESLLEEFSSSATTEICEDVDKGERIHYWRGEFARANFANLNKRVYPMEIMREAVDRIMPEVQDHRLVGELTHPATPIVNPKEIAVYFPEIELKEDGRLVGIARPSSTPNGEIVKGLLNDGIKVGFSTRATGSVRPYRGPLGEGLVEVQKGLTLRAIDVVWAPSASCFPEVVSESQNYLGQTTKFKEVWQNIFG
jgi:hypothetical protein